MPTRIVPAGLGLSLIFATCETYGAATGDTIPQPVRVWMVGVTLSIVVIAATQVILERLDNLKSTNAAVQRADSDYEDIKKRLRNDGDVTYLFPEE